MDLILAAATRPFAIAIGVVIALALIEIVMLLFGAGISEALDGLLPDIDLDAADSGPLGTTLSFFGFGNVPVLVVLISFLTLFGLAGYLLQGVVNGVSGGYLPALLASAVALVAAVLGTKRVALPLGRLMPNVETSAVSTESFVGRTAIVATGNARPDEPAQARFRDTHGQMHYVLVEPDAPHAALSEGEEVLLVGRKRNIFLAIPAPAALRHD